MDNQPNLPSTYIHRDQLSPLSLYLFTFADKINALNSKLAIQECLVHKKCSKYVIHKQNLKVTQKRYFRKMIPGIQKHYFHKMIPGTQKTLVS